MEQTNLLSIFKNLNIKKFIVLMITIFLIVIAFLYHQAKTKSNLQIDITKTGATVIISNSKLVAAQFLLPASARWTNTGIKFEAKSVVEVTASGMVHLAIKGLIDATDNDRKPPFDWCSPNGLDFKSSRPRDAYRRNFLINPEAPMGVVIGYFQKEGDPAPGMQNPRPKDLITIYEHTNIVVPDYPVTLWLIINDIMLDPRRIEDSKQAYFGPLEAIPLNKKAEKDSSWDYIVLKSYWDIWFDDNVGNYLIQLKLKD